MDVYNLGPIGEEKAVKYLQANGCKILDRNFTCKYGEIDIIVRDHSEIVFVEVKTRGSKKYGEAREAVDRFKRRHIKNTAEFYIMVKCLEKFYVRFDVIEVYFRKRNYSIKHIKNIW